jgi:hypothetical protein
VKTEMKRQVGKDPEGGSVKYWVLLAAVKEWTRLKSNQLLLSQLRWLEQFSRPRFAESRLRLRFLTGWLSSEIVGLRCLRGYKWELFPSKVGFTQHTVFIPHAAIYLILIRLVQWLNQTCIICHRQVSETLLDRYESVWASRHVKTRHSLCVAGFSKNVDAKDLSISITKYMRLCIITKHFPWREYNVQGTFFSRDEIFLERLHAYKRKKNILSSENKRERKISIFLNGLSLR